MALRRAWHQVCRRAEPARRTLDGRVFDSMAEMNRYAFLRLRERAGEIADLECQPAYPLTLPNGVAVLIRSDGYPKGRRATYHADFRYRVVASGALVVEDLKGRDDPTSRLRRAIVEAIYGIHIEIVE